MDKFENKEINFFAKTNYRNKQNAFGIKTDDRRRHMYVIGKTGMGKTTLIQNMAIQDIRNGKGMAVIDPHGEFAEDCLEAVPAHRINDVIYFNPADLKNPVALNVLECQDQEFRHLIASGLVGVFKKIWADSWGPRLEYILRNAILALLEDPDSTLLGVTRILIDKEYRARVMEHVTDPLVRSFWEDEFSKYNDRMLTEAISPIQNKVGQFLSTTLIRNIVGQTKSAFDVRKAMDEEKILIMNLAKGRIGEDNSALLGAMMITKIQLAAMSRVDIEEGKRKDFYLYVDEFQNFATESFAGILSEARKYRLNLILAHQYIAQLEESVKDAVFGNVGTIASFRIGAMDSETLEKEFEPVFFANDLVNLNKYHVYLKLMIDGVATSPFSAASLEPIDMEETSKSLEKIIQASRERYSSERGEVEDNIMKWSGMVKPEVKNRISALAQGKETKIPPINKKQVNVNQVKTDASSIHKKGVDSSAQEDDRELFSTKCWGCGVITKIPFKPDGKRPIFCKDCLKNYRREQSKLQKQLVDSEVSPALEDNLAKEEKVQSSKTEKPFAQAFEKLSEEKEGLGKKKESSSEKPQIDTKGLRDMISSALKTEK
ncbi:type IV secretion system DNA-binding domain-containing protein [bacterium]|jgi:CxxC-x17-CxxC domain-containing protein|nr:type IV secretion system DNA-binding domain-containing protein [bacterium]MBT4251453.1 type IV secretion system DNA-binding domain-containing protein [bacterium]MBT4597427.1 type IV secretion system DNA-binding domain-containing protein [bacterium]MBT6754266.1 type IV secretion system DNA-binding domain-containing protein [bacterium]MBT7037592.1 type IV secretion system DNA-binding domain-containing protein [bacterium]